jgi:hypothetical protein
MTITRNIILGVLALQFTAITSVHADPACLVGKWHVQSESIEISLQSPTFAAGSEWSVAGGLTIEIESSGALRFDYDDYVLSRKTRRGGYHVTLEVRYDGASQGAFLGEDDPKRISFQNKNKVPTVTRHQVGDQPWTKVDEGEEWPPHMKHGITFECSGDELTLIKSEEGPFGGAYRGLFERVN